MTHSLYLLCNTARQREFPLPAASIVCHREGMSTPERTGARRLRQASRPAAEPGNARRPDDRDCSPAAPPGLAGQSGLRPGRSWARRRPLPNSHRRGSRVAVYLDLKAASIGEAREPAALWAVLAQRLEDAHVLSPKTGRGVGPDEVTRQISRWLSATTPTGCFCSSTRPTTSCRGA